VVEYAMRYGSPSIQSGIDTLKAKHCDRILVLPLYPQYASSTTGTVMDELGRVLANIRNVPGLRVVRNFHDHPAYIEAMVKNLQAHWMKIGRPDFSTDKLVMTFHGLPRFHLDKGDPYHCECYKTARLVAEQLGLTKDQWLVTFQSRFGNAVWLQPYTDATLEKLGQSGTRRVDIICPGFAADCLETLEEIAMEGKETFLHAGGKEFNYLPVANDSDAFVNALKTVAIDNLAGWLDVDGSSPRSSERMAKGAELARALGAEK
jgi:protoporphyrin/coproporphyrin ferrochelatase